MPGKRRKHIWQNYIREFDRQVSLIKDLVFYRRYVDDMIFIFVPSSLANIITYKSLIDDSFPLFH